MLIETGLAMAPGHGVSDTASSGGANALLVIIGIFLTFILGRFLLKKLSESRQEDEKSEFDN